MITELSNPCYYVVVSENGDTALTAAWRDVCRLHAGQTDLSGTPYAVHLAAVAGTVGERAKRVAMYHDSVEDGKLTEAELRERLSAEEADAVLLLTRDRSSDYGEYIAHVAAAGGVAGELAREVKLADLRHNAGRLTSAVPGAAKLRARYGSALEALGATSG